MSRPRSYTMEEYAKATSPETRSKIILSDIDKKGWGMTPFVNIADDFKSKGFNVSNIGGVFVIEKPKESKKMEEPKSPGAKGEEESNPQAEVRYKTPEDLMIPTMSDEDLSNSIDGIERGQSDLTDAEKPIALGWIKNEMKKRKSAIDTNDNGKIEEDEMADFQKSLDDYAAKNKKGREDIPATYKR